MEIRVYIRTEHPNLISDYRCVRVCVWNSRDILSCLRCSIERCRSYYYLCVKTDLLSKALWRSFSWCRVCSFIIVHLTIWSVEPGCTLVYGLLGHDDDVRVAFFLLASKFKSLAAAWRLTLSLVWLLDAPKIVSALPCRAVSTGLRDESEPYGLDLDTM